ncbi:protein-glutamate methylesterase/protein-glutamine glutaminase [Pseudochryseolinea flava]|uniref:Protein-glutamate methylesterase/protein-glutamine glutaminase n=1 Tax=Pseudochryseolinea flava TaxID=2059302 RepID=A0A364Y1K3_9BACT|nr:chemotaxis response regulator protein-glutamate methylesterase [Pseudochryseolinea flava]RAW00510.1 chemotaxis response regulator protein-glutamate methylesterase [Pseudochryseolinea flava]
MARPIKVLIIDDSALVRQTLTDLISADPSLEVIGKAADPIFAVQHIKKEIPDVITLDIEMPRMDGITFLKTLMAQCPVPVVIISSLTQEGSNLALQALDHGAVEILSKSEIRNTKEHLEESKIRIIDAIKAAYMVPVKRVGIARKTQPTTPVKKSASIYKTTDKVIAVGASTGGTEALRLFLRQLPVTTPGVLITQHMPAGFTKSFAEHCNKICEITVTEATNGERVLRGHAYIAPGGKHMELVRSGALYYIKISDGELVNRHKPSVDVLFNSVARHAGQNAVGVIMTGMGKDGAQGLLQMKEAGAKTIAQDEASCIVFGMPKEAIKLNAADYVLPLTEISKKVH